MSNFNYIPEEIVIDILQRLSSRSLIRFRCVCKSWRDLIGRSSFARSHLNRNVARRSNRYLYAYHQSSIDKPEHCQYSLFSTETFEPCLNLRHPLWTREKLRIYGSSNGLVCISDEKLHPNSRICIWNPSIRKSRTLPNIETHLSDISTTNLSFGFHPELNDYMVVRIVHPYTGSPEIEVYTLSTNSWKSIRVTPPWLNFYRIYSTTAFLKGTAYWTAKTGSECKIVAFDAGSEEFQELMVPKKNSFTALLVCEESLCLFQYDWERLEWSGEWTIDSWMMKERSLNNVDSTSLGKSGCYFPLSSSIDKELLIAYMYIDIRDEHRVVATEMALYNIESEQLNRTGIRLNPLLDSGFDGGAYIESLVLLSG
ncbi:F-box/kelch-repeat protein [Rosa sericea]